MVKIYFVYYSEDPTCPTYYEGSFRVATDTGRYWNILEDTGEAIILENHTGEQVFCPNILEIYWNYSYIAPIVLRFIRLSKHRKCNFQASVCTKIQNFLWERHPLTPSGGITAHLDPQL